MLNLNSIMLGSKDPQRLADFYEKIIGMEPGWKGGDFQGWKIGSSYLMVGPHDHVGDKNSEPGRLMFNFETADVAAEFERIKGCGAEVVTAPYHPGEAEEMWLATFADPDGNYFQLASPMPEM